MARRQYHQLLGCLLAAEVASGVRFALMFGGAIGQLHTGWNLPWDGDLDVGYDAAETWQMEKCFWSLPDGGMGGMQVVGASGTVTGTPRTRCSTGCSRRRIAWFTLRYTVWAMYTVPRSAEQPTMFSEASGADAGHFMRAVSDVTKHGEVRFTAFGEALTLRLACRRPTLAVAWTPALPLAFLLC